jgi:pimeloyl-ACP methyl ester carboxylesterase
MVEEAGRDLRVLEGGGVGSEASYRARNRSGAQRRSPDARLKVYPDTGHAVSWERSEWVVRDLEELMKDTRPA